MILQLAVVVACTTSLSATPNKYITIKDNPNIPNCVLSPQEPYPGGTCEQVMEFVNFGNTNVSSTCPPAKDEEPLTDDIS